MLSKVAEEFVVEKHLKPAILTKLDRNQFGSMPNSSSIHTLISMLHNWNKSTDGNGSSTRIILFDFRKAFDMIDHRILIDKLAKYDIPKTTLLWILDFITDRRQRVKLSYDCLSEWKTVPVGVPQGTKLGLWLFLTMINDLDVMGNTNLWKYVDDSTLSEVIGKHCTSSMQDYVNEFVLKADVNGMQLKESKCKELRICLSNPKPVFDPVVINGD